MASKEDDAKLNKREPEPASAPDSANKDVDGSGEASDASISNRVYVGNLSWHVDWRDLKDLFRTTGHEVVRADVMKTKEGRSKGCGIVEFATSEGAKQAVLTLNDAELKGRQIFVREDREHRGGSAPGPSTTRQFSSDDDAQSRRVYVGNLSWDVQWPDLKDHMKAAGNVVHCEVICEHNGRSKGCGVVEYETAEEAKKAIDTLTHSELKGRVIFVREDREGSGDHPIAVASGGNSRSTQSSIYVWNMSSETDWRSLKDHMRKAGNVEQATILKNGSAIVVYQKPQEAARALRELQDSELDGQAIKLREDRAQGGGRGRGSGAARGGGRGGPGRGRGGGGPSSGAQIYVGNLSPDTDWRKLKDHFKQIGEVDRADAKQGKFGTIRFVKKEDAAKAIEKLNGVELDGSALEVRMDQKS